MQASGFETRELNDGLSAVAAAIALGADLIVMDIGLPNVDGVEVTRSLKADTRTRDIPVLAVSAHAMPADEKRMRDAGCNAFLSKPLKFQEFLRVAGELTTI